MLKNSIASDISEGKYDSGGCAYLNVRIINERRNVTAFDRYLNLNSSEKLHGT